MILCEDEEINTMTLKTYVVFNKQGTEVRYTPMDKCVELHGKIPISMVGTKIPIDVCHLIYKLMKQVYDPS